MGCQLLLWLLVLRRLLGLPVRLLLVRRLLLALLPVRLLLGLSCLLVRQRLGL